MRLKDHALSLVFAAAFIVILIGQSIAGLFDHNEDQLTHGGPVSSW